jgi:hypothetical protein
MDWMGGVACVGMRQRAPNLAYQGLAARLDCYGQIVNLSNTDDNDEKANK